MTLGCKIRKIREIRELKQDYLADKLNLSVTSYGKIERNEVEINITRAEQISAILKVKLTTLLDFNESELFDIYDKSEDMEFYSDVIKNLQSTIKALLDDKARLITIIERTLPPTVLQEQIHIIR